MKLSGSLITLLCLTLSATAFAGTRRAANGPSGAPGIPHRWAPALKQAIGTAYEPSGAASPVWFTLAEGIITEVFYPTIDRPQVGDIQLLVTDGHGFFSEQKRDTVSSVLYKDAGMTVVVSGQDGSGRYSFEQEIFTDPASPVLRIRTRFQANVPGLRVFVLFKPAIDNSGSQNLGYADQGGLYATTASRRFNGPATHAALVSSVPWGNSSAGYVGFSDGWQDLSRNFRITQPWKEAGPGNVALTGELLLGNESQATFELALGFGQSRASAATYARTAMGVPFDQARAAYENGWKNYLRGLQSVSKKRFVSESFFAQRSAQIIKMHEDKSQRGAVIASLSSPGVPDSERAPEANIGGYHLVWPRDLYHAAMGLLAAGDTRTPIDILRYYAKMQKSDGSWSQNFWVDGRPYWTGLQMDQVAFPILLASQLKARLGYGLSGQEMEMVRRAASFILSHGPRTQQDRWEEIGGFIPSTIAAQIAALRAATELTGDPAGAAGADGWQSLLERWTFVNEGPKGRGYYLRASPSGEPNRAEMIDIANGMGRAYAWEILDGGFLELVRLGVRPAADPRILSTLRIYDDRRSGVTDGFLYKRYNRDGYGPGNVGGFWPLLSGERGHYAVAAGDLERARGMLHVMERNAMPSGLMPEQVVSDRRVGLGVACPLVWAHAEDILLHRSIEEGRVYDMPFQKRVRSGLKELWQLPEVPEVSDSQLFEQF